LPKIDGFHIAGIGVCDIGVCEETFLELLNKTILAFRSNPTKHSALKLTDFKLKNPQILQNINQMTLTLQQQKTYLEDHPRTCKWLITHGDRKSPKDRVVEPLPNGLKVL